MLWYREHFTFESNSDHYQARPFAGEDSVSHCAQRLETESRSVFRQAFTALRALLNIVLALLFEILSLLLHLVRTVSWGGKSASLRGGGDSLWRGRGYLGEALQG